MSGLYKLIIELVPPCPVNVLNNSLRAASWWSGDQACRHKDVEIGTWLDAIIIRGTLSIDFETVSPSSANLPPKKIFEINLNPSGPMCKGNQERGYLQCPLLLN